MFRQVSNAVGPRRRRFRQLVAEPLEARAMLTALPLGATPADTGEFMLGRVAVTPVLFESDGSIDPDTQDWTSQEIIDFLDKTAEGLQWWTDTLAGITNRHELEFVIDPTFANTPFSTGYEPIGRVSDDFLKYGRDFLDAQGLQDVRGFQDAVYQFNHAQRERLNADWAFTIFVAASDPFNGRFADGGSFTGAFAFAGGQFIVMPSVRPASTITHETGHIFWARDEYPGGGSWNERRGYYDTENFNAADNPTPGFVQEPSIMRGGDGLDEAYAAHTSPASTLAMIGWQDSDGDGVFDLADVPLRLTAEGSFDPSTSMYRLVGSASAVPLINRNSSGNQSDITLNRISRIEYSVDDGPWQAALSPDVQVLDSFDVSVPLGTFSSIRWRAIDDVTGITSETIEGSNFVPALSQASLLALAFVDENGNGFLDEGESLLADAEFGLTFADGAPVTQGSVAASELDGEILNLPVVTLSAVSPTLSSEVYSYESTVLGGQRVFHSLNAVQGTFSDGWRSELRLKAAFDAPVGQAELTVLGLSRNSFARVEAYDAAGNLISRATSQELSLGDSAQISIADTQGRITSLRVFGHAGTRIAVSEIQFGPATSAVTGDSGVFTLSNLPAAAYRIHVVAENVTLQPIAAFFSVDVTAAPGQLQALAIRRVDSPLNNVELPEDVNSDGDITAADALSVIRDLNVNGTRSIVDGENVFELVDVNNDGRVSAADALAVINYLNFMDSKGNSGGSGEGEPELPGTSFGHLSTKIYSNIDAALTQWPDEPPAENPPTFSESCHYGAGGDLGNWGKRKECGVGVESPNPVSPDTQNRRRLPRNPRISGEITNSPVAMILPFDPKFGELRHETGV